jgi:hypothetical protein
MTAKFVVDANVLSEATRPQPSPRVLNWLRSNEQYSVVSAIILGELEYGILLLPRGKRRTQLERWFAGGIAKLQVAEMDRATAYAWCRLLVDLKQQGRSMPVRDSLIAATARQYGLTVATRNTRDYQFAGVKLVNPFGE